MTQHHVSASCEGERCTACGAPASHKVGEEIQWDDPSPMRHNLTAYLCCFHFAKVFGAAAPCHVTLGEVGIAVLPNDRSQG